MSDTFESPRRSPNNESDVSYGEDPKSVGRSEHGSIVNTQRADTETTISIFDTALSEAPGSADTADDSWLFEPSDDQRPTSQQDDESEEDRFTKYESSVEEGDVSIHKEVLTKDAGPERDLSSNRRSWHQDVGNHNERETETRLPHGIKLAQEQIKMLTTGISVDSRGAWEGWCEGKLFICPEFTMLIWERRAAAFAALNMSIADITGIDLGDIHVTSPSGVKQRRVQFSFSGEAIYFQFERSPHHDEFFGALEQLLLPAPNSRVVERQESLSPMYMPLVAAPSPHSERHLEVPDNHDEDKSAQMATVPTSLAQKEPDIDLFKRKLQRGFLVEKHGRLGKPHAKLIFTDALCSHIMWTKPPTEGAGGHQQLFNVDDYPQHHRTRLFSHNKSIPVDSITAIVTGKQTTVFRRAASNKTNDRVCLSILTPTRTLDICAYSLQGFQELYRGFSLLLEEIKRTHDELD
ncbi:hypothetical protein KRP22_012808 [Phytophthora ramorum]|nr:hypothetical protein KRP22_8764 [Phytophthora ramorum]